MKKIILGCLVLLVMTSSFAGRFHSDDYSEIIENLPMDKSELFDKTKQWVAKTFNSSNSAIQYSSIDDGRIIVKGVTSPKCDDSVSKLQCFGYSSAKIGFTLTIDLKDHRARFMFQNPNYVLHGGAPLDEPITDRLVKNSFKDITKNFDKDISQSQIDTW